MARPAVVRLAGAMRSMSRRHAERHGRRAHEGVVRSLDPLTVEVPDLDYDLDDNDITIARTLEAHFAFEALGVGDSLVLVETEEGDYTAVDVLPDDGG